MKSADCLESTMSLSTNHQKDELNIDTFYKVVAYTSLYKSYGKTVDERKADEITMTLIRKAKPVKLFQYFEEHGIPLENPYKGYIM